MASHARAVAMPGWAIALVVLACCFVALPTVAVFAAIAAGAWQAHTVRVEIAQGIEATGRARALVGQYIGERGQLPVDNGALGLPQPGAMRTRYVANVRVVEGKIVVTYGNRAKAWIRGGQVVLSPLGNATRLHWRCASPEIRTRYLPRECRD